VNWAICLREAQRLGLQAFADPIEHFLGCRRDQHWLASNAVERLDALFRFDDAENVLGP
jgi:hypothetical protein